MRDFKRLATFVFLAASLVMPADARTRKGEKLLQQGREAEARKQWETALDFYEQAMLEDPADAAYQLATRRVRFQAAMARVESGQKLRAAGRLEDALAEFQRAYAVDPPNWIVQNAANGAVGKTLAKIAKSRKKNVLNLVRSDEAVRELADHGIEGAISTSAPDWRDRVKAAIKSGKIMCAIDSVGGKSSGDICSLLTSGGKLVAFGSMTGEPMQLDSGPFIFKQVTLEGFWLSKQNALPPEKSRAMIGELVMLAAKGELDLPVAGVYPLERAAEAARASATSGRRGKVILSP
jgi:NADPH:quinone reductase-like Zn-dependent oxidoreductase